MGTLKRITGGIIHDDSGTMVVLGVTGVFTMMAAMLVWAVLGLWRGYTLYSGSPLREEVISLGAVTAIDNCTASQYTYTCDVVTDASPTPHRIIRNKWVDGLEIGDTIGVKLVHYEGGFIITAIRNGKESEYDTCSKYSECYDNYTEGKYVNKS